MARGEGGQLGTRLGQVLEQDPAYFENTTRMSVNRDMVGIDHQFRGEIIAMCAFEGDHAITRFRELAHQPILLCQSDNVVVSGPGSPFGMEHGRKDRGIGRQRVDARRNRQQVGVAKESGVLQDQLLSDPQKLGG